MTVVAVWSDPLSDGNSLFSRELSEKFVKLRRGARDRALIKLKRVEHGGRRSGNETRRSIRRDDLFIDGNVAVTMGDQLRARDSREDGMRMVSDLLGKFVALGGSHPGKAHAVGSP